MTYISNHSFKAMELKSVKVLQLLEVQTGMGKRGQWKKREIVVEQPHATYPRKICLTLWGDTVDQCPNVGERITASIDLESREYQGRWFTDVKAWKIIKDAFGGASKDDNGTSAFDNLPKTGDDSQELPF